MFHTYESGQNKSNYSAPKEIFLNLREHKNNYKQKYIISPPNLPTVLISGLTPLVTLERNIFFI